MHKNIQRRDAPSPQEMYCVLLQRPDGIAQKVIDAVSQYNNMELTPGFFNHQQNDERQIKEAEENETQAFLEGLFDMMQQQR